MARVYLDTSFISACVTTREDPSSVVRRSTSLEWLKTQSARHEIFISAEVVNELDSSGFRSREAGLELASNLTSLEVEDDALGLAAALVHEKVMPGPVGGDAVHVAACCVHRIEYLLSWNVRHLANPNKMGHLRSVVGRLGFAPPMIVTPDLLWEDSP
jgi:predicted nucleic acid-binding protein